MLTNVNVLSPKILDTLNDEVAVPKYDRNGITPGIVHIGVGGFHRAHQAFYMDQLFNLGLAQEWGIIGVGLMESDKVMYDALTKQQGLYTLTVQHPGGASETAVIGSIQKMLLAPKAPNTVIDLMAQEEIKIISLTITEGGYNVDPNTGNFLQETASIVRDIEHPHEPKTVFGYLTAAFRKRKELSQGGVTILSCDNVQHNGDVCKKAVIAFAKAQDPNLVSWIEEYVSFPNAMVDRITPSTSKKTKEYVTNTFNLVDEVPVNCEPFIQWVIEDNFSNGRPPLEKVGVQFVPDVTPYEQMKLRLLNAGHSVVGITGALHGFDTIDTCVQHPVISQYLRDYLDKEVTPCLAPVKGIGITAYKDTLIERFKNPNIKDGVARICSESSAKLPKFVIPTILANLEKGGPIKLGVFLLAAWCYYSDKGVNEKGNTLEIIDNMSAVLHKHAAQTSDNTLAFLKVQEVFGDLINNKRFTTMYTTMIDLIYSEKNILTAIAKL